MEEIKKVLDKTIEQLHKVRIDLIFSGEVIVEVKELWNNEVIKVWLIKYQTNEHYHYCNDSNDHSTATNIHIKINLEDFEDWTWDNDLQVQEVDAFYSEYGHYMLKEVLEFSDYFTDDNVLDYIKGGNKAKITI